MKRCIQHQPLLIRQYETSEWPFPVHNHNHYELITIRSGTGYHVLNGSWLPYQPGDVFLLGPLDDHYFVVDKKTHFYFFSFTEFYLTSLTNVNTTFWRYLGESSQQTYQQVLVNTHTGQLNQQQLTTLLAVLMAEQTNETDPSSSSIVESLMSTILSLLERHLSHYQPAPTHSPTTPLSVSQQVVAYICQHITRPNYLRMERLADTFHYSPSHLSALFKQQVGESLQHYIIQYKLQLVEARLRQSTLTISQIADEFGFTDVCHLNKLFKRRYRHSPTNYRRSLMPGPTNSRLPSSI